MTQENSDKDWTQLESYVGLTPEEVIEKGKTHIHLLVLGKEPMGVDIAKAFEGEFGDEADTCPQQYFSLNCGQWCNELP